MSILGGSSTRPAALRTSIRDVESRIRRRRGDIGAALGSAAHRAGEHMTSTGALLAAGMFGAAMQRDHRLHGLRMLAILQTANAGLRLLITATSRNNERTT
jgi:hypothetical protein